MSKISEIITLPYNERSFFGPYFLPNLEVGEVNNTDKQFIEGQNLLFDVLNASSSAVSIEATNVKNVRAIAHYLETKVFVAAEQETAEEIRAQIIPLRPIDALIARGVCSMLVYRIKDDDKQKYSEFAVLNLYSAFTSLNMIGTVNDHKLCAVIYNLAYSLFEQYAACTNKEYKQLEKCSELLRGLDSKRFADTPLQRYVSKAHYVLGLEYIKYVEDFWKQNASNTPLDTPIIFGQKELSCAKSALEHFNNVRAGEGIISNSIYYSALYYSGFIYYWLIDQVDQIESIEYINKAIKKWQYVEKHSQFYYITQYYLAKCYFSLADLELDAMQMKEYWNSTIYHIQEALQKTTSPENKIEMQQLMLRTKYHHCASINFIDLKLKQTLLQDTLALDADLYKNSNFTSVALTPYIFDTYISLSILTSDNKQRREYRDLANKLIKVRAGQEQYATPIMIYFAAQINEDPKKSLSLYKEFSKHIDCYIEKILQEKARITALQYKEQEDDSDCFFVGREIDLIFSALCNLKEYDICKSKISQLMEHYNKQQGNNNVRGLLSLQLIFLDIISDGKDLSNLSQNFENVTALIKDDKFCVDALVSDLLIKILENQNVIEAAKKDEALLNSIKSMHLALNSAKYKHEPRVDDCLYYLLFREYYNDTITADECFTMRISKNPFAIIYLANYLPIKDLSYVLNNLSKDNLLELELFILQQINDAHYNRLQLMLWNIRLKLERFEDLVNQYKYHHELFTREYKDLGYALFKTLAEKALDSEDYDEAQLYISKAIECASEEEKNSLHSLIIDKVKAAPVSTVLRKFCATLEIDDKIKASLLKKLDSNCSVAKLKKAKDDIKKDCVKVLNGLSKLDPDIQEACMPELHQALVKKFSNQKEPLTFDMYKRIAGLIKEPSIEQIKSHKAILDKASGGDNDKLAAYKKLLELLKGDVLDTQSDIYAAIGDTYGKLNKYVDAVLSYKEALNLGNQGVRKKLANIACKDPSKVKQPMDKAELLAAQYKAALLLHDNGKIKSIAVLAEKLKDAKAKKHYEDSIMMEQEEMNALVSQEPEEEEEEAVSQDDAVDEVNTTAGEEVDEEGAVAEVEEASPLTTSVVELALLQPLAPISAGDGVVTELQAELAALTHPSSHDSVVAQAVVPPKSLDLVTIDRDLKYIEDLRSMIHTINDDMALCSAFKELYEIIDSSDSEAVLKAAYDTLQEQWIRFNQSADLAFMLGKACYRIDERVGGGCYWTQCQQWFAKFVKIMEGTGKGLTDNDYDWLNAVGLAIDNSAQTET